MAFSIENGDGFLFDQVRALTENWQGKAQYMSRMLKDDDLIELAHEYFQPEMFDMAQKGYMTRFL